MLDERPDEFDERNLFFQAILGLISASGRLDAVLAKAPVAEEPAGRALVGLDDPWLLCVLGVVALRGQAMALLGGVEASPPARPEPCAPPSPLREILR